MTRALEGLVILDLTQVMAGPFCCQVLGDLGARVIKVEPPGTGDQSRNALGFRLKGEDTVAFLAVNRNKESICLDLKTAGGREVLHRLATEADVLVESFRPGVTTRLGIDHDTLSSINPRLIYASLSGFGQTGPYSQRAGYDLIAQGMAGLMSVTGAPNGEPVKSGVPIADMSAGLFTLAGILAAVAAREKTGVGQQVDCSLYDAALALSVWETAELWGSGHVPTALGSAHRFSAPYQALRTGDGYLTVGANNDRLWRRLCAAIGRKDLVDDERFATNEMRMRNREMLEVEIERELSRGSTDHWVDTLGTHGVPCGPINDYATVCNDPHTRAREMVVEMTHPVEGTIKTLGLPIKLSGTPGNIRTAAPLLGEHTDQILADFGYSTEQVAALRETGAAQ